MIWGKKFDDDFVRCEKCAPLEDHQEDEWCNACKQNFAYIWKLENQNQILQGGLDKVSKIILGMGYILNPGKK